MFQWKPLFSTIDNVVKLTQIDRVPNNNHLSILFGRVIKLLLLIG